MASWGQAGTGARAGVMAGGAVVVAAVGALAWWLSREAPEVPAAEAPAAALVAPEAPATPAPQPLPAPPAPPTFDLVRVEADGAAQVAGRGAPLATVLLQIDGAEVADAAVGGDGAFLALFTLAPNPLPSLLSLVMVMPDGTRVPGRDTVALAPIAGPVVAAADPAPAKLPAAAQPVAEPVAGAVTEVVTEVVTEAATEVVAEPVVEPVAEAVPVAEAAPEAVVEAVVEAAEETVASPPVALLVTEQGVQVLQASTAAEATGVSIDSIGYTADGAVQIGGKGQASQVVRLYLDNAELAEASVTETGLWSVTRADIAPGLYTLRADQLDDTGKVTSRFETPFQRETLVALAEAAAPQAPALEPAETQAPPAVVTGAAPGLVPADGPEAVDAPDPLPAPAQPALPPLVSAPAKIPVVDPVSPSETAAAAVASGAGPVTADADPAPTKVAAPPATAAAPSTDPAPASVAPPVSITVQPGSTLWAIAEANFGDGIRYVQVYEANKDQIRNPDLIYPGQVFKVPAEP